MTTVMPPTLSSRHAAALVPAPMIPWRLPRPWTMFAWQSRVGLISIERHATGVVVSLATQDRARFSAPSTTRVCLHDDGSADVECPAAPPVIRVDLDGGCHLVPPGGQTRGSSTTAEGEHLLMLSCDLLDQTPETLLGLVEDLRVNGGRPQRRPWDVSIQRGSAPGEGLAVIALHHDPARGRSREASPSVPLRGERDSGDADPCGVCAAYLPNPAVSPESS